MITKTMIEGFVILVLFVVGIGCFSQAMTLKIRMSALSEDNEYSDLSQMNNTRFGYLTIGVICVAPAILVIAWQVIQLFSIIWSTLPN